MAYLGTQPNDVKKNTGLYTPSEILQLTKDGSWGGSLELIESQTVSGVSSLIFTDIKELAYDVHYLVVSAFKPTTDDTALLLRFFESGVEESASVYQYAQFIQDVNGSADFKSTGNDCLILNYNTGSASGETGNNFTYFYNLGNSAKYSFITGMECHYYKTLDTIRHSFGGGILPQTSTVNQIKLFVSTGNFSANVKLFGVKQI